jgi:ectoine hydroxylase-related dioxygenase (phytanoyl-CoA dioxygenase family)
MPAAADGATRGTDDHHEELTMSDRALGRPSKDTKDEWVREYHERGYAKFDHLYDDAELKVIKAVREDAERRVRESDEISPGASKEEQDLFAWKKHEQYTRMFNDHALDLRLRYPELRPIVAKAAAVARALLGSEDIRVMWDKTFVKPTSKDGTMPTVWHQDQTHLPLDRRGFMTVWIALEDVPAESGALTFVPRSHRLGPLGRTDFTSTPLPWTAGLSEVDLMQVQEPVTVPLLAGDATIHDGLMLHGAGPNLSDAPRPGWTITFFAAETAWTGGPHPHAPLAELGMKPFDHFDSEQFIPPASTEDVFA